MSSLVEECDKAIAAHGTWKVKFKQMIAGETKLDAVTVRRCDVCEFGKWLGDSGKSALGPQFQGIYDAHKHFHGVAADVVQWHNAGEAEKVTAALATQGDFSKAGAALTNLIVKAKQGLAAA
jgi:hypothetical protein